MNFANFSIKIVLMEYISGGTRKPVAVKMFTQNSYPENPVRQVEYEFVYIEKGSGTFFWGNTGINIKAGDFLFIDSFEEHSFRQDAKSEILHCSRLIFDISALGNEDDSCRAFFMASKFCRFLQMPTWLLEHFTEASHDIHETQDLPGRDIILRSILLDVLSYAIKTNQYEMISDIAFSGKRSLSAIENALVYIKENYVENLSLRVILQLTNYSKSQFIRLFKESTGMNVSEYINKYRIEKACLDLIYTNRNITEIATTSGFNNIQYFSRKFKEYMKCTPKQYQKKKKKLIGHTVVE